MADEDLTARLKATGQSAFSRSMRKASGEVSGVGRASRLAGGGMRVFGGAAVSSARGLRMTAGIAGGALAGGLVAAGVAMRSAVGAFEEKRQIVAQTGAVLKSTGGAANVTEGQIDSLSTRLSRMSGVDDETVRQGQNLLLTFRDIRNEPGPGNLFADTTKATLDMAAAMGMDMPQAALQIGKAINDPARGFKRLQRIGVSFTKTQEDQIKHFTAVGDRMGAQRVILRELNKEFAGSAAAQMTPLKRLQVSWGNIQEAIGGGLAPAVDAIATKFDTFFVKAEPQVTKFGNRVRDLLGRKDLTGKRKLELVFESGRNALAPLANEVRGFWAKHRQEIIAGAQSAVSSAGAGMANAAAAAAPHAASMFVRAFRASNVWGQLLTVGLVAKKLGVFGALGRMGCNRMGSSWKACAPGQLAGGVNAARGGRMAGAFRALGTFGGPLMAAVMLTELVNYFASNAPGKQAESGNPEGVRSKHVIKPGEGPTGAQIYGQRTKDPIPANDEASKGHNPGIPQPRAPRGRGASVTPFARKGVRPAAMGRTALLHVEVPVHLKNREVGRGMARIAADDLGGP